MSIDDRIERRPDAIALGRWENEGGALRHDSMDIQYGRRIESDAPGPCIMSSPAFRHGQMAGL